MRRRWASCIWGWTAIAAIVSGCASHKLNDDSQGGIAYYQAMATAIETPAVTAPSDASLAQVPPPPDLRNPGPTQYWNISLLEVMQYALAHARVLQDLGGTLLRAPETIPTTYWVALQETDPQYGPEAALSAFDAQLSTSLFFQKTLQEYNNRLNGVNGFFAQQFDNFDTEITKRAVTGDQFTLRHSADYNQDNNLGNQFPGGAYDAFVEGEVRHPFLQGSGVDYNRIAGPGAQSGVYNGVIVARLKTDVSLTQFQIGLRDYVSNLENAYWDLYFAYRDLDTKIQARDEALETWRNINALHQANRRGGETDKEAQAREQYFQFEEDVQNALVGRELDGTRTYDGSTPGTFRGLPGVRTAERKLRQLMGLPPTDGRLIRPSEEPPVCYVNFDWPELASEALNQREELRQQRWVVKGRELELMASHNFLKPNLDFVGRYGMRGFGSNLLDTSRPPGNPFDNAYRSLVNGDFPEWQVGLEFSMPIGFRDAHAGVRHAELGVTQARAILREQELQVLNNLTGAVDQVGRAYLVLQTSINRAVAAKDEVKSLQAAYEADKAELFVVLDAHRRYAEALSSYYQARVEYVLAIRNVYFEKGSLLEYCNIALAEGSWPIKAYSDSAQRERLRGRSRRIDFTLRRPPVVSQGPSQSSAEKQLNTGGDSQASPATTTTSANPGLQPPSASGVHEMEMLEPPTQPPPSSGTSTRPIDRPPAQPDKTRSPTSDLPAAIRPNARQNSTILERWDQALACSWQSPAGTSGNLQRMILPQGRYSEKPASSAEPSEATLLPAGFEIHDEDSPDLVFRSP